MESGHDNKFEIYFDIKGQELNEACGEDKKKSLNIQIKVHVFQQ